MARQKTREQLGRELRETIYQKDTMIDRLRDQIAQLERTYTAINDDFGRMQAHNRVLQEDRDRLTAAVEILSRRLASPYADKDPIRGGPQGANTLTTDPKFFRPTNPATDPARR